MSIHKVIIGEIVLTGEVEDDGTLAQKIAEILMKELKDLGVREVTVDFELASENIENTEKK